MAEPARHEEESETTPGKLLKSAKNQPWWVLVLLATLPPLVSSYFSYRASVVEARMKTDEAKADAEAGYKATKAAVEELQEHDKEYGKALAGLNGHVEAIERFLLINNPNRGEMKKAKASLHLPPTVPLQEVKKAANSRVDMPDDLDSAPYFVKTGKIYRIGKIYEGPAEGAPDWSTLPAANTPEK